MATTGAAVLTLLALLGAAVAAPTCTIPGCKLVGKGLYYKFKSLALCVDNVKVKYPDCCMCNHPSGQSITVTKDAATWQSNSTYDLSVSTTVLTFGTGKLKYTNTFQGQPKTSVTLAPGGAKYQGYITSMLAAVRSAAFVSKDLQTKCYPADARLVNLADYLLLIANK